MTPKLPSIPDPGQTPASMAATILAMRDVLRQLVANASSEPNALYFVPLSTFPQRVKEIANSQIAAKAASGASSRKGATSADTTATVGMTLASTSDVLVIAAFTGPQTANPGGTGTVIASMDGADRTVISIATQAGVAFPISGAVLFTEVAAGSHTFTARAEFTTGPTLLPGVSIIALSLAG